MTGRPLRMACIGNISIVGVMVAWADDGRPGHAPVRLQPVRARRGRRGPRRPAAPGGRGHDPAGHRSPGVAWRRPAPRSTTTSSVGRSGAPWCWSCAVSRPPSSTPAATPSCAAGPSGPSTRSGPGCAGSGVDRAVADARRSVVAAAVKAAGSDDLGSDSYREPLEVFLAVGARRGRAHHVRPVPRQPRCCRAALANRIELHRWAAEHPEVRDERIDSPWVIVGLPRTGTSLLSNLLGLDPMARPLLQWEAAHPIPPPTLETAAEDPRIAQTAKELDGLMKLNPPLKAMHPFGATLAAGVRVACSCTTCAPWRSRPRPTCRPTPAGWSRPTWRRPTPSTGWPCRPCSRASRPSAGSSRRPTTCGTSTPCSTAYPDARIIWTHRDPGPVVTSLASLANAGQRPLTSRTDPRPTAEEWKRKCPFALELGHGLRRPDARPDGASTSRYDDLMADPVGRRLGALRQLRRRGQRPARPTDADLAGGPAPGRLRPPSLRPGRLRLDLRRPGRRVRRLHGKVQLICVLAGRARCGRASPSGALRWSCSAPLRTPTICVLATPPVRMGSAVMAEEPRSSPLRSTVTGPSSLTTMTVAVASSKL